jgi:hypothetical protein
MLHRVHRGIAEAAGIIGEQVERDRIEFPPRFQRIFQSGASVVPTP